MNLDLLRQGYEQEAGQTFYAQLTERIEALPGVRSAAVASVIPVNPAGGRTTVAPDGYTPQDGEDMELNFNQVGPGFFETMGIPMVSGRAFDERDHANAPPVMLVNQAFVARYWQDRNPIGAIVRQGGHTTQCIARCRSGH